MDRHPAPRSEEAPLTQAKYSARNPRRRVLLMLQQLGRLHRTQAHLWNQTQTRNGRPLTEPEKWENRPASWVGLLQDLDAMQEQIEGLRKTARFQLQWLKTARDLPQVPAQRREALR